ncbi:MAG: DUF402 domain-containing protein [Anaerolineales bacterium]
MSEITVVKQNSLGVEVVKYQGKVVERGEGRVTLKAPFSLENGRMLDIPLIKGDPFIETYYSDRWYNIYEIRSADDDRLKGWYCNVAYPAEIGVDQVTFRDLALDLLVYPDGRQIVLDEDEFAGLNLSPQDKLQALDGLEQVKQLFVNANSPSRRSVGSGQ